jgi:hypothetical protein
MAQPQRHGLTSGETLVSQETTSFDRPGGMGLGGQDYVFEHADVQWRGVIVKNMQLRRITVMCMIFNRMIGKLPAGSWTTPMLERS